MGNVLGLFPGFFRITNRLSLATPSLREAGFTWNTVTRPGEGWEIGRELLDEVFSGQRFYSKALDYNTVLQILHGRGAFLKVVRGRRMLLWVSVCFRNRSICF